MEEEKKLVESLDNAELIRIIYCDTNIAGEELVALARVELLSRELPYTTLRTLLLENQAQERHSKSLTADSGKTILIACASIFILLIVFREKDAVITWIGSIKQENILSGLGFFAAIGCILFLIYGFIKSKWYSWCLLVTYAAFNLAIILSILYLELGELTETKSVSRGSRSPLSLSFDFNSFLMPFNWGGVFIGAFLWGGLLYLMNKKSTLEKYEIDKVKQVTCLSVGSVTALIMVLANV